MIQRFILLGLLTGALSAQPPADSRPAPPTGGLRLAVSDAVALATTHNLDLRIRLIDQLIAATRIAEADAAFEPAAFGEASAGRREYLSLGTFPVPDPLNPGQTVNRTFAITSAADVARFNTGVRGRIRTGMSYELSFGSDYRFDRDGGDPNPTFTSVLGVSVTQPLLRDAFTVYNTALVEQARNSRRMTEHEARRSYLDIVVAVHEAYWELVYALRNTEVTRQSLDLAAQLVEINRVKVAAGAFARIEITAAEAGRAARVNELLVAENAVRDAEDRLRRLILPFDDPRAWDTPLVPSEGAEEVLYDVPPVDACVDIALQHRPEIRSAELDLRNRDIEVERLRATALPRLDLVGSAALTGLSGDMGNSVIDPWQDEGAITWSAGISFEVPLGNQARRSALSRGELERVSAVCAWRNLQIDVVSEIRAALRQVDLAARSIATRRTATELAEEELRNEQLKLDLRTSTNFQVLSVQDNLAQRRREETRAILDYRISLARLARAMGTTLDAVRFPRVR